MEESNLFNELKVKKLIIQAFIVFPDLESEPIELTKSIKKFVITRFVKKQVKPIYQIGFDIDSTTAKMINKSKTWYIECKTFFNKNTSKANIEQANFFPNKFLVRDIRLKPYVYPENRVQNEEGYEKVDFKVECFEVTHFNTNTKSAEIRLQNADMKSALIYLISTYQKDLGIKRVVINNVENTDSYNEVQIRDGGIFSALKGLDEDYGLFSSNATFFIENSVLYVINGNKFQKYAETPMHTNDLNVVVSNGTESDGCEEPDTNKIFISSQYVITNTSDYISREIGSKVNFYTEAHNTDTDEAEDIESDMSDQHLNTKVDGRESSFVDVKVHNRFSKERFQDNLKPAISLNCSFPNCDITQHNVNTQYSISFQREEDKRYNGIWTLDEGAILCEFDSSGEFSSRYDCTLVRVQN